MKSGLLSHSSIAVALMEALAFAVTNTGAQVTDRLIESVSVSPVRILYFRVEAGTHVGQQGGVVREELSVMADSRSTLLLLAVVLLLGISTPASGGECLFLRYSDMFRSQEPSDVKLR